MADTTSAGQLALGDWAMVWIYFILCMGIGLGIAYKNRNKGGGATGPKLVSQSSQCSSDDGHAERYFLAGREAAFWAVGASLFASNIGSEHFIGLAGSGAKVGMCVSWGEWLSPFAILLLGWVFVPLYIGSGVFTMPEFLERRYSRGLRTYYACLLLFLYVLTKVSVALYAGAVVLQQTVGWDLWSGAVSLVVGTGIYTATGGMAAVIYTEVIQTVVLIAGGLVLLFIAMQRVGGFDMMWQKVPGEHAHLFQPPSHEDFPWTGVFFGMPFTSIWYWCTDQNVVQRVIAAKSPAHARAGAIFAAYLKILPPFMMVIPGIVCRALYQKELLDQSAGYNVAFPYLVVNILPSPLLGLMIAAMLAALMSSLASVFNSTSTIFTMDVWRNLRKSASEKELVLVGKVATVVMTILGILWIPLIQSLSSGLYIYTHKVMAYMAPPITVVFLGGVLWPRANQQGAWACLMFGFFVGNLRLVGEISIARSHDSSITSLFFHSNFLHFAAFFGFSCFIMLWLGSILTSPPPLAKLAGLTIKFQTRYVTQTATASTDICMRALQDGSAREEHANSITHRQAHHAGEGGEEGADEGGGGSGGGAGRKEGEGDDSKLELLGEEGASPAFRDSWKSFNLLLTAILCVSLWSLFLSFR